MGRPQVNSLEAQSLRNSSFLLPQFRHLIGRLEKLWFNNLLN